jgi:hypothetical protein
MGGSSLKTFLLDGKYKVGIVKERGNTVYVLALEDALIPDIDNRLQLMEAGRVYSFCKHCFKRHVKEVTQ